MVVPAVVTGQPAQPEPLDHPRRFGLASHLGLWLDVPTLGCAKSVLVGKVRSPGQKAGALAPLKDGQEIIGSAVRTKHGIKPVYVSVGHKIDLASAVRLSLDDRIPTAAITGTGRLLVNQEWFDALDLADGAFVMAHELFHLCLRTHERGEGTDPEVFNWAHDYVINDMLREETPQPLQECREILLLVFQAA